MTPAHLPMKIQSIQVLIMLALVASAPAAEPSAKSLSKCPSGHETLKDVPIVYGLPPFQGPAAEKWDKGVENLEFVSGGCSVTDDSPKHQVACTTCRFAHSIFSTRLPQHGAWTRTSPDAKSFPKTITDLVKSFPIPTKEHQKDPVTYTQSLRDGLEVRYEGVSYRTTKPADQIKADVNRWLKVNRITCNFSSRTHTSTLDDAVRDILEWKTEELSVSIRMHHEHSDKTSWIHATFFVKDN
jgi:hypothetical protein